MLPHTVKLMSDLLIRRLCENISKEDIRKLHNLLTLLGLDTKVCTNAMRIKEDQCEEHVSNKVSKSDTPPGTPSQKEGNTPSEKVAEDNNEEEEEADVAVALENEKEKAKFLEDIEGESSPISSEGESDDWNGSNYEDAFKKKPKFKIKENESMLLASVGDFDSYTKENRPIFVQDATIKVISNQSGFLLNDTDNSVTVQTHCNDNYVNDMMMNNPIIDEYVQHKGTNVGFDSNKTKRTLAKRKFKFRKIEETTIKKNKNVVRHTKSCCLCHQVFTYNKGFTSYNCHIKLEQKFKCLACIS